MIEADFAVIIPLCEFVCVMVSNDGVVNACRPFVVGIISKRGQPGRLAAGV